MKKEISKTQAKEEVEEFFQSNNIKNKTSKEIKKIKRLMMSYNIKLKDKRKLFCKKCLAPYYSKSKIKIANKYKTIICNNCGYKSRWKIKK